MQLITKCPICECEKIKQIKPASDSLIITCIRCGEFNISGTALASIDYYKSVYPNFDAKISYYLSNRKSIDNSIILDSYTIENNSMISLPGPNDCMNNLINIIVEKSETIGEYIIFDFNILWTKIGIKSLKSLDILLTKLVTNNIIELHEYISLEHVSLRFSFDGWQTYCEEHKPPKVTLIDKDSAKELDIFISYSWSNEILADSLDLLFNSKAITLKRDKREINYRDSIKAFMQKVRKADYCLMIISDSYLKSKNCMYEVLEFVKDENYTNKILPIITKDTKIFTAEERLNYIKYWQDKKQSLDIKRKELSALNQIDIIDEMKMYENIERNISEFLSILSDFNLIQVGNEVSLKDFKLIYNIINPVLDEKSDSEFQTGFFVVNVPRSMRDGTFIWMKQECKGYTNDIREAKIYNNEEIKKDFIDSYDPDFHNKKFLAIPIKLILSFEQSIITFTDPYIYEIQNASNDTIGNKNMYLTEIEARIHI